MFMDEELNEETDKPLQGSTLLMAEEDVVDQKEVQEHLKFVYKAQKIVHEEVEKNIKKAQKQQQENYARRQNAAIPSLEVGQKVLLKNLRRADRKGGKEEIPNLGPYIIDKDLGKGRYTLRTLDGQKLAKAQNEKNLKIFHERQHDKKEESDDDLQNRPSFEAAVSSTPVIAASYGKQKTTNSSQPHVNKSTTTSLPLQGLVKRDHPLRGSSQQSSQADGRFHDGEGLGFQRLLGDITAIVHQSIKDGQGEDMGHKQ